MINENHNQVTEEQNMKEDIFKRLDKRKENLEQQRSAHASERSKNAAENQAILNKLNEWSTDILTRIEGCNSKHVTSDSDSISNLSPENSAEVLTSLSEEIQKFDSFFNEKSNDLSPYDVRQTQAVTVQIKEKFVTLQDSLKPKKKFGFKSKLKKNVCNQSTDIQSGTNSEKDAATSSVRETRSYEIINPNSKNMIVVPGQDVKGIDVNMNSLRQDKYFDKITVKILGSPATLHATNLDNVTVLCGPVRTSIFVENCTNCDFVVACQQLRIHTTKNSNFYLHVTAKGIIEDCNSVGFAPYNLFYPTLKEDLSKSGLNLEVNNWDNIDDFNWLSNEQSSPNWHILPESQRTKDWML